LVEQAEDLADELNGGIALFRRGIHVLRGVERRYMDC